MTIFLMFIESAGTACPIGYYTSPWFGNLLLQKLDWYIEQSLYKIRRNKIIKYVKHYVRYMDDMVLLGSSKTDLYKSIKSIKSFLADNFGLKIKESWEIKELGIRHSYKDGIDICGYKFFKNCTILRDGIFISATRLIRRVYKHKYVTNKQAMSILSRVGWSKMAYNKRFLDLYVKPFVNLKHLRRIVSKCGKKQKIVIQKNLLSLS